ELEPVPQWPEGAPEIKAVSAVLSETERGQILYGKNTSEPLHIAALSKLMTILIAVESGNLSANITISKDSVDAEGSALSLEVGEKYTLEELLSGIMLTSANDAAKAVAEHIAGDSDKFTAKMNETAARLMMKNTHFSNPTGLFDENQFTTADDILIFMNYSLKNPVFNRLFGVQLRPWTHQDGKVSILTSQNNLFWSYDGVDGGKTGYNDKDRQALITTATRGNMRLICIMLDSPEKDLFKNAAATFDYGFANYKKSILVKKDEVLKSVESEGNEIKLISNEDIYYVHPSGESYIREYSTKADLQLPLKKSKISGSATYILKDNTVININLYPSEEFIPPEDFYTSVKKKIAENKDIFYLVIFLLVIEVILILTNIIKLFKMLIRKISR
ncbi:MAG: D-alanyl-D-alanine carboxypeptidase, partial [Ruminiclostridium sp.]|nr:D-alanyl-D-alanine carboxypeptidase [Ruminiclostridium sp.]